MTLKFTVEVSLGNNKDTTNTPDFKLKGEFIVVKESMDLFALGLGEQ